jgi:hypothetical protein
MSIPVAPADLQAAAARHAFAYLLTVGDHGRPHAVAVQPGWSGGDLTIAAPGRTTARNAAARPDVSLLWPPAEPGGYSLIADGRAVLADDGGIVITPSTAVLHRPAPAGHAAEPGSCGNDCLPVTAG